VRIDWYIWIYTYIDNTA